MFTDPIKNLKTLGIKEDNVVADIGAGTGYYSISLGFLVPRGKVYAVELQKDFIETIKNRIKEAHLGNVEVIWGNAEKMGGTKIADHIIDLAVLSNILFQVEDRDSLISETLRILRPRGRVLLIDWSDPAIIGVGNVISKIKAQEMFESKGFVLEQEIDAGSHHYGMILRKI